MKEIKAIIQPAVLEKVLRTLRSMKGLPRWHVASGRKKSSGVRHGNGSTATSTATPVPHNDISSRL